MSRTRERGSALVVAMVVLLAMMMIGLASLSIVDGQSAASGKEHVRESSFNAAESVLNAEMFTASANWPGAAAGALPDCAWNGSALAVTPVAASTTLCPDPTTVTNTLTGQDFTQGLTWSAIVRDNGGTDQCTGTAATNCSRFWNEATSLAQPHWDANADGEVWVRSQANVRGSRRTVVGRIRITQNSIQFPKNALTAGSFQVTTGGPKPFLTLNGSTLGLRCDTALLTCLKTTKAGQIVFPGQVVGNYQDGGRSLTQAQIDQLRATAQANGTYYGTGSCPSGSSGYTGSIVFVENASCQLAGAGSVNSAANPGMVLFAKGSLRFTGAVKYYGMIYMANGQGSTASDIFDAGGASTVTGAVFIDGGGGFSVGGNTRIVFDPNAVRDRTTNAGTGLVRNSFREIGP
jgi:Tfp pilus assembly protein PilX